MLEPSEVLCDLVPAFNVLTSDEQDSVRLLAVEACSPLAHALPLIDAKTRVLPIFQQFGIDKSWRVRYAVAQQMPSFAEVLPTDVAAVDLLHLFIELLRDR